MTNSDDSVDLIVSLIPEPETSAHLHLNPNEEGVDTLKPIP